MLTAKKIMEILKEKHGKDLNIKDDVYYLFLKGAVACIYLDEDTKTLKVDFDFLPEDNTFIYHTDISVDDLL
jgi:predicted nucleotidyltransferase